MSDQSPMPAPFPNWGARAVLREQIARTRNRPQVSVQSFLSGSEPGRPYVPPLFFFVPKEAGDGSARGM